MIDNKEPHESQFMKKGRRSRTPPLNDRVVVYDYGQETLQVRRRTELDSDPHQYYKLELKRGETTVTLFVDPMQEADVKTSLESEEDGHYVQLAKLSLDRLGLLNRGLLHWGKLNCLYVPKTCLVDEIEP